MKVTVVFFGDFARFKPASWSGKRGTVEVPEGATIDTLAQQLGIGEEPCAVMLDEEQHHRGAELHSGDTITFLPPIAGGGAPSIPSLFSHGGENGSRSVREGDAVARGPLRA